MMGAVRATSRRPDIISPGYLAPLLVLLSFASVHRQASARHAHHVPNVTSPDDVLRRTDDANSACDDFNTGSFPCRCDVSKTHRQPEVTCRLLAGSTLPTGTATSPFSISTLDVSHSSPELAGDVLLAGWVGRVHVVKLRHCRLTVMPEAWLRIPGLRALDLSHNELGDFPTESRPRLRQLDLSHNRLAAFVINHASMRQLNLAHNKLGALSLAGAYPKSLGLADLSHNRLHQVPLDLWQGLRRLDLSYNLLSRLPFLVGSSALMELDVSHNRLTEIPVGLLSFTPHLHSLSLAGNHQLNLSHDWPEGGRLQLGGLKNMNLSHTGLLRAPRALLAETPRLQHLDLSQNRISRLGDEDFSSSGVAESLLTLRLSHNALRHLHPSAFRRLQSLRHLDLSHNALLGEGLGGHVMLPEHVIVLDLRNCSLKDVDLCQLSQLHELRQLYMHGNPLLCTCHLSLLYRLYGEHGGGLASRRKTSPTQRPWACVSSPAEAELRDTKRALSSGAVRSPFTFNLLDPPQTSKNETNTARAAQNSNHRTTASPDAELARKETGPEPYTHVWPGAGADPASEVQAESNETNAASSVRAASDVTLKVKAQLMDDVLITTWDVSQGEARVRLLGFRVVLLRSGQSEEQGSAVHESPVLPGALRTYALTDMGGEDYTVCVDLLLLSPINDDAPRVCQEVPHDGPIVLVGILAGTIFLLPCLAFLIFITVKDKYIIRSLETNEDAGNCLINPRPFRDQDEVNGKEMMENGNFPPLDGDPAVVTWSGCRMPAGCQSRLPAVSPPASVARPVAAVNVATQTDTCVTSSPQTPTSQLGAPKDLPRERPASAGPTSTPAVLSGASVSTAASVSPGTSLSPAASLSPMLPEPDRLSLPDRHDSSGLPLLSQTGHLADDAMGGFSDDSLHEDVSDSREKRDLAGTMNKLDWLLAQLRAISE